MSRKASPPVASIGELMPQKDWVLKHGAPLFKTLAQWQWFCTQNPTIKDSPHFHKLSRGVFLSPGIEADVLALLGVTPAPATRAPAHDRAPAAAPRDVPAPM